MTAFFVGYLMVSVAIVALVLQGEYARAARNEEHDRRWIETYRYQHDLAPLYPETRRLVEAEVEVNAIAPESEP